MAVVALALGPFLYRSMLPAAVGSPPVTCSFVALTGGLFVLLIAAVIWLLWGRRSREPDLGRQLWEAALGEGQQGQQRGADGEEGTPKSD